MRDLRLMRNDAAERREARKEREETKRGFGRHGTKEPLVDRDSDDTDTRSGRCQKRVGRSGIAAAVLALAMSNPGCWASGPIEGLHAPDNGHETDTISDSDQLQDAGLVTCAGEVDPDKEEFLPQGGNARLTRAGHMLWVKSLDQAEGTATVKITDSLWNQIGDEIEFSENAPSVALALDGETFDIIFCGIVESDGGFAAQFRSTRPRGFVHCLEVDCGGDFGPFEHVIDASSTETIVGHSESEGEVADNDYEGDCAGVARIIIKQELGFAAPLPTQNNLSAEDEKMVVLRHFDGDILGDVKMDLLEADGEEGSVKIGTALASGNISAGGSMVSGNLVVTMEEPGADSLPGFSYGWPPDPDALIWETAGSNPNEKEVHVQADSGYHSFVIRYTGLQEGGSAYVKLFEKAGVQILKDGGEAMIGGQVYTATISMGGGTIAKVTLNAVE